MSEAIQIPSVISESLQKKIAEHRASPLLGASHKWWPMNIRNEILKIYKSGVSGAEIHRLTGISGSLIVRWARISSKKVNTLEPKIPPNFVELKVAKSNVKPPTELRMRCGQIEVLGFTSATLVEFFEKSGLLTK